MNAIAEPVELLDLVDAAQTARPLVAQQRAVATPAELLQIAVERGADLAYVQRLMDLQERHQANEARNAYNEAFAAFKAEAIRIIKNRTVTDGPLKAKKYAELFAVVNAVTPALSRHGLSASWQITKDERDWIEVTCTLKHAGGHSEAVTMGGPPDTGGAKNAIQSRASTVSYLERYTLKAILGLSEQDEDDDGAGGKQRAMVDELCVQAAAAKTAQSLEQVWTTGVAAIRAAKDMDGYEQFKAAVKCRKDDLAKKGEAP